MSLTNEDKQWIAEQLAAIEGRFREELKVSERRIKEELTETMRDMQTEILRAFSDYHVTWDNRFGRIEMSDTTLAARMTALENRVFRLETKPPQP